MRCRNCGSELIEGSAYCADCGFPAAQAQPSIRTNGFGKKPLDFNLQYILSAVVGVGLLIAAELFIRYYFGLKLDSAYAGTVWIVMRYLSIVTVLVLMIGTVLLVFLRNGDMQKKNRTENALSVTAVCFQAVLILSCLFLPSLLCRVFASDGTVIESGKHVFMEFSLAAAAASAFSCLVVRLRLKTFLSSLILYAIAIVPSILFAWLSYAVFHWGFSALGIALGIIQPVVLLVPNTGHWAGGIPERAERAPDTHTGPAAAELLFCPSCGLRFSAEKRFCEQCGTELKRLAAPAETIRQSAFAAAQDAPSGGIAVLSFFFPAVGLILYLVWKEEKPLKASSAGKGALAGAITYAVLLIAVYAVYFALLSRLY